MSLLDTVKKLGSRLGNYVDQDKNTPGVQLPVLGTLKAPSLTDFGRSINSNPYGRFATSAGKEAVGFVGDVGRGFQTAVQSARVLPAAMKQSQANADRALQLQMQARDLQNKKQFAQARSLMDQAELERNRSQGLARSIQTEYQQKALQSGTGGVKSLLSASGLKAGLPAIATTGLFGAGIGAGIAKLSGEDVATGAGQGLGSSARLAGLSRLTGPVIDKVVKNAGKLPLKALFSGGANVLEDNAYTAGTEGRMPTAGENLASFGIGTAGPIASETMNLSGKAFNQIKSKFISLLQQQNPKKPLTEIVKQSEDILSKKWKKITNKDGAVQYKRDLRFDKPVRNALDVVKKNKQSAYGLAAGLEVTQDENGDYQVSYNPAKGVLAAGLMVGANATGFNKTLKGTFSSMADKKVRFEIDDSGANFKQNVFNRDVVRAGSKGQTTLGEILDHPELYKQYPEAKNMPVIGRDDISGLKGGYYDPSTNTITVDNFSDKTKSTLLHEIQHAIQEKEGFATGGSPENVMSLLKNKVNDTSYELGLLKNELEYRNSGRAGHPNYSNISNADIQNKISSISTSLDSIKGLDPMKAYQRLSGEVEARDVQSRMNLSPEQRATTLPYQSQGIPVKDQIVRFESGTQANKFDTRLIKYGSDTPQPHSDIVARERFNIPELKKISSGGSDRDVYDLGDKYVLKVAKTARGMAQNMSEGEPYAPVPKSFESGKNYVVVEKSLPPDTNTKKMVSELKKLNVYELNNDRAPNHYDEVNKAAEILNKYGVDGDSVMNYNVMWNDLSSIRNWGTSADGTPVHVDAGTFNSGVIEQYKGVKNLNDPEFRDAYNQSRLAKKQFGDSDPNTMYSIDPQKSIGTQSPVPEVGASQIKPNIGQQKVPALGQENPQIRENPSLMSAGGQAQNTTGIDPVQSQLPSSKVPSSGIIPRDQVPASNINTKRLDLNPEQQTRVTDSQVKELRDVLGDKEVERIAKGAGIDTKTHTTDQQAKKIAEQLNVRRQIVELENQRTQLLGTGTPEQLADITRQIAEKSRISREQGTEVARQLAARRIIANEINTPMQRVFQLLDQAGVNPDVYAKDAAQLDFRDGNKVVDFYRKYVPAKWWNWIDPIRYNSMLSSPNTFINNAVSNLEGSAIIAPIEKTITGGLDAIKSVFTKSDRNYYAGEGPAYAKGYFQSLGRAKDNFLDVMRGKNLSGNLDYRNVPLTQSGGRMRRAENILQFPMKALEATDQFFTTLTKGGVEESLNYRASKGGKTGDIGLVSQAEAAKRLFRSPLGDNNGSKVLDSIDILANSIQRLKGNKNPVISTIAKFTLPFVQTPTNILKQGVEYSPAGLSTLWGSSKKTEQLSKIIMGTSVATGVAMMVASDRLTWAEPTSDKQKNAYRAAGMQPYSVKIGDKWVSYSKLHPAIAFNFALVAAVKDAWDKKTLTDSEGETVLKGLAKWGNFFADQSYMKSIGDMVASTKGDIEAPARTLGNYAQQTVPYRALLGWVARIVDPYQRKVDPDGNILQKQLDQLKTQIPFVSMSVPARTDAVGEPIKNQNVLLNAFSPNKFTTENPEKKNLYNLQQEKLKVERDKKALKDQAMKDATTGLEKVGAAELPQKDNGLGDVIAKQRKLTSATKDMKDYLAGDLPVKDIEGYLKKQYGVTQKEAYYNVIKGLPNNQQATYVHQIMIDKSTGIKELDGLISDKLLTTSIAKEMYTNESIDEKQYKSLVKYISSKNTRPTTKKGKKPKKFNAPTFKAPTLRSSYRPSSYKKLTLRDLAQVKGRKSVL